MIMTKTIHIGITGATGFVGKSLVKSAITQGWKVHAFSRNPTGIEGVIEHFWDASQETSPEQQEMFSSLNLDAVIHCAAKADDWGNYEDFDNANVRGTRRALAIAPQARFIYISTASVYLEDSRKVSVEPIKIEPTDNLLSHSTYAYTKLLGEHVVLNDNRANGAIVVRPHIVYGPGDTTLLPRVLARTKIRDNKARLLIPGGGKGFHSVTSITTLTDFLLFTAMADINQINKYGKIFNIADTIPVILSQKIKEVIKGETGVTDVTVKSIPVFAALTLAQLCQLLHKTITKKSRPFLTTYVVKELTDNLHFNDIINI
jgi:nucleoside-diphosphate-sugar epimerase